MGTIYIIISGVVGLLLGFLLSKIAQKSLLSKLEKEAQDKATLIVREAEVNAENTKKDKMLEAKEHFLKKKSDFEDEIGQRKSQMSANENKLKQKEQNLSKEIEQFKRKEHETQKLQENLSAQLEVISKRKDELEKVKEQQVNILVGQFDHVKSGFGIIDPGPLVSPTGSLFEGKIGGQIPVS